MKKKTLNSIDFASYIKRVKNSLDEDAKEFSDVVVELLKELDEANESYTLDDVNEAIDAKFEELKSGMEKSQEEAIANAMAEMRAKMQKTNSTKMSVKDLSKEIRNGLANVILKNGNKKDLEDKVNAYLVANDVTGLTFADVIDYTISTKWEDLNPLFAQLHKTPFGTFHYTEQDYRTAKAVLAKQWGSADRAEKVIQQVNTEGKSITTKFVYKRQAVSYEDKVKMGANLTSHLNWLNVELDSQIINTIVMAILLGDTVNDVADRVTTFETIGTKTVTDAFTTVLTSASASEPSIDEVRKLCDSVKDYNGKGKVLVVSTSMLTALSRFVYANGGTASFRTKEEMASQFGVKEIIALDLMEISDTVFAICMIPAEYWVKEDEYLSLVYEREESNKTYYQKERMLGGKIHGLNSTAVLLAKDED